MLQKEREKVMRAFKNETLSTIVATDIAARGIDVADLTFVVHYQLPDQDEYYTHRSGRTARAGKEVISAYWFDGLKSSLIYRFSPFWMLKDDIFGLSQSIGHYWEWASMYCCGTMNDAGKVMGLVAFGEKERLTEHDILSITDNGKLNLDFQEMFFG